MNRIFIPHQTENQCDGPPCALAGRRCSNLLPFTDLSADKVRPAVVVSRVIGDDLILAFMTSRLDKIDWQVDVLLEPSQGEFSRTGLKAPSVVRLSKLATLHRSVVKRRIGSLGQQTVENVERALRYVFEL